MTTLTLKSEAAASALPAEHPGERGSLAVLLAIFLLVVLSAMIWPGDVLWINDEPRLIAAAWHANQSHTLSVGGLYGNFGIRYGPAATQIYQALLLLTHDPETLAMLRSFLSAGVTVLSLLWLARTLRLSPWLAAALCLAPQVWQFQRVLWDASFAIPMGALAMAACASFFERRRPRDLLLALGATLLLPFIHPQDLPLFAAIGGALAWKGRRELRLHWKPALLVLGAVLALNGIYIVEALWGLAHRLGGAVAAGYPTAESHWRTALAPFLGGNLLSDYKFTGAVTAPESSNSLTSIAGWVSRLIYPLAWAGIALAARNAITPRLSPTGDSSAETRTSVERILLTALTLQAVLFGVMRIPPEPQYFFGSFVVQALLPWLALDAMRPRLAGRLLSVAYAGAVCFVTLHGMMSIHRHGYGTQPPWITLGNQVKVARELNRYSDAAAITDAPMYQAYPQALRALRLLLPPEPGTVQSASHRLFIRASTAPSAPRGQIELVEEPAGAPPPPEGSSIDLTPLPAGWQPAG